MTAQRISVVIPCYNAASTITEQLDALGEQSVRDFEVVVADNGSTDASRDIVVAHRLGARLVDASQESGAAHARSVGTAQSSGDLILYCDADDVADPFWVENLATALDRFDLVGGKIEYRRLNPHTWKWNGADPDFILARPLPYAGSGNLGIRRSVLDSIGGWPEFSGAAGEDVTLCWKAQIDGYTLGYEPGAVMHCRLAPSISAHTIKHYHYGYGLVAARARFPQLGKPSIPSKRRFAAWAAWHLPMLLKPATIGQWGAAFEFRLGQSRALRDFY